MAASAVDSTELRSKLMRWGGAAFDRSLDLLVDALRDAAPLGTTGATRRGIQRTSEGGPTRPAGSVRSTGKGGSFVEEGTEPHVIVAQGKALRFLWGGGRVSAAGPNQRTPTARGSGVVFFKSVQHPGFPARPWFAPTLDTWEQLLAQAADAVPFT